MKGPKSWNPNTKLLGIQNPTCWNLKTLNLKILNPKLWNPTSLRAIALNTKFWNLKMLDHGIQTLNLGAKIQNHGSQNPKT
jgi:hypothetical protein